MSELQVTAIGIQPNVNAARMQLMRERLELVLAPTLLELQDDSHKHVGHAGAKSGGGHFSVKIASAAFAGVSALNSHRMIYAALGDLMQRDIHALAIQIVRP